MDAYAILRLIDSVGKVDSRKRLQKAIYLLQAGGLDLGADYDLHLYGPYSRDLAETVDDLAEGGFLEEGKRENPPWGLQYSYQLTEKGKEELERPTSQGKAEGVTERQLNLFSGFCKSDLSTLELAATIAFFHRNRGLPWDRAKQGTAEFKGVKGKTAMNKAAAFAQAAVGS